MNLESNRTLRGGGRSPRRLRPIALLLLLSVPAFRPAAAGPAEGTPAARSHAEWQAATAGVNLAFGKSVRFSLEPDYHLTRAGDSDLTDLTDGRLSELDHDKIWFDPAAVGWYESRPTLGVNLRIDLGSVQPVEKVVARFLAGAEQGGLVSPADFAVFVSEDGRDYRRVATLTKLAPAERNRAGEPGNYFLEEPGAAYVHAFSFPVRARARYIGLYVRGATDAVFCDEIAVLRSEDPATLRDDLASLPAESFVTEGLLFGPAKPVLAISTNIVTPNFFRLLDCRPADRRAVPASCVIELPEAVRILSAPIERTEGYRRYCGWAGMPPVATATPVREAGRAFVRWTFPSGNGLMRHPLFLAVDGELPPDAQAVFYAECEGSEPNRISVPIRPIEIPAVPPFEGFHVSLAWMDESNSLRWPEFFEAWRHMGFDSVSTFPRNWGATVPPEIAAWLGEARRLGFQVLYNESPFHGMVNRHRADPEIYSQLPSGPSKNPCPAYRGPFYRDEIKRVGDHFEQYNPDIVFYDIELWYEGGLEAPRCSRCLGWQKQSGRPMAECLVDMGTGMLEDLRAEIALRAGRMGRPMPVLAMYDLRAGEEVYQFVHSFARVYPKQVQWSQPSLYCLNRIGYAHESMKKEIAALNRKPGVIVPWLTAGTYGEADSWAVEALILECLLNGAAGFTYYYYNDFDTPLDFQAHARALASLAPYQGLLRTGRPCEARVEGAGILTSAWWNGKDEALVLLGNYDNREEVRARLSLPFRAGAVTDLRAGGTIAAADPLVVPVPGCGFRLLHVRAEPPPPPPSAKRPWWKLFG